MITNNENSIAPEVLDDLINALICYQGGGYDGCFLEWNFAFIDCEKQFHSLFHSGHAGCDTIEKMKLHLQNADNYDPIKIYSLDELSTFADSYNEGLVLYIAKKLYNMFNITFTRKCDRCHNDFACIDLIAADERGCGGLATQWDSLYCEDCVDAIEYENMIENYNNYGKEDYLAIVTAMNLEDLPQNA